MKKRVWTLGGGGEERGGMDCKGKKESMCSRSSKIF